MAFAKILGQIPAGPAVIVSNHVSDRNLKALARLGGHGGHVWSGTNDGEAARGVLRGGGWVIVPPEGCRGRSPHLMRLPAEAAAGLAVETGAPVVPVWVDDEREAVFSFEQGAAVWPGAGRRGRVAAAFGPAVEAGVATAARMREELLALGARLYADRPMLGEHLGLACVRGLKRRGLGAVMTDVFRGGPPLAGIVVLGTGLWLAWWLRRRVPEGRVAIVLPPGAAATLANLAVVLAGKVPVNLNFTAGAAAVSAAAGQAGLRTAITAEAFAVKLKDFPWPPKRVDLAEVLGSMPKPVMLCQALVAWLLPARAVAWLFGVPQQGGDREAGLLFTSGSAGEPKGVVLTHRNLVGNVAQVAETLQLGRREKLLGCLPTFHSFGFTVTVWYPLLGGPEVVSYVSPLDSAKLAEIIEKHGVDLVVSTPTFLRGFLKRARPEQFRGVRMVVTGAEKLPVDLAEEFERRFGVPVREGYGLTETSPVISVNLLDPSGGSAAFPGQVNQRRGSVGRPVPGVAVRVTRPDTGERLPTDSTGLLWFRGVNIFPGYLGLAETNAEVLRDGWFQTGDLGRMDADGFLFIEGRLSRFSKIGGEMVPHGTVEQKLAAAFPELATEAVVFAVAARAHPEKGEELVLLASVDVAQEEIARKLREAGVPNLWIPRVILRVESIPVLASGKLDLRACRKAAEAC